MSTPSAPDREHTESGSQAAQEKSPTTEKGPKNIDIGNMMLLLQWLIINYPKQFEEKLQYMKTGELRKWLLENNLERFNKLLPSWAMEETADANANNPASRTPAQISAILPALRKDWNNSYFPHSLMALRDLIRQYQLLDVSQYYAKSLVFVQSSGMGKSRLADTFGQSCPMINFILRESGDSGFPPPDGEILSFLRDKPPANVLWPTSWQGTSSDFLERRVAVAWNYTLATALLQASFEIFHIWVKNQPFTTMTLKELASGRHAEMATLEPTVDAQDAGSQRSKMRIEFCDSVAKRARVIAQELISSPDWIGKFDDDRPYKVHRQLEMAHSEHRPNPLNSLLNAAENLMKILQQCRGTSNTNPLLVIVFDEASSFMRKYRSDESHTGLYMALDRVISYLKKFPAWFFFLSTESLIGHLVPSSNTIRTSNSVRDSSARIDSTQTHTELMRFPPFVSLRLDVEDRRRMQNPILRKAELLKPLKAFATLEHMALFGRPLWYAYARTNEDVVEVAKLKLISGKQRGHYIPIDPNHVFAALSFRLSLDVCSQNPSTVSLTERAVKSFMRVVISMDHETGVMETTTPSEPILARAAMEYLCSDLNWSDSIQTLCWGLLEKGLIEKGRKGALYARLVLILAHDWVRWAHGLRLNRVPKFASTFTVSDFLMALYAGEYHDSIRKIPERICEARMNFTHFVPAYTQLPPEVIPEICHDLLRRSGAMQLSWDQQIYDLLIPVYYGTEDEKFDPSNCGVIVVQVKNQNDATTPREIFEEDFINVGPETSNLAQLETRTPQRKSTKFLFSQMANPILFLLFDLGVVKGSQAYAPLIQVMHSESGLQPDLWAIHSRGHGHTVFGCLQHMDAGSSSERLFASVQTGNTPADRLSLRNRPFYQPWRSFRYEGFEQEREASTEGSESEQVFASVQKSEALADRLSRINRTFSRLEEEYRYERIKREMETSAEGSETSVQKQGVNMTEKEGEVVNIEARKGKASNTRSKGKEVERLEDNRFGKRAYNFAKNHFPFRRRSEKEG
ncbi:uncharacterized protein Z518_07829 [Rhinocladiella mackenziei CBS 650.93]|uniref:Uncharacterized protein n=1 Tax=Rhinocladiella mackenziei CBS 650.93 TaxID=1442369 RepID=A0A0D2IZ39_9EURO|nr:uncharacterized protein Z518_07829 [Rhinocladiella mackenziei CBS 650.93]KIX01890.1 hypothetical protein Z518_07829 [Rhinocladiella mackenziei CBS 650.93]